MRVSKRFNARPKTWYSKEQILSEGSREIATIRQSPFRRTAIAVIGGTEHQLGSERLFKGPFFIQTNGEKLAAAEKPNIFWRRYAISYDGHEYVYRMTSRMKGSFGLFEKNKEIGTIAREGFFSRTTILKVPDDLPLPVVVLLFWLVLLSRQRRSRMR